jgi:hypothetical protein
MLKFLRKKRFWITLALLIGLYFFYIILTGQFLNTTSKLGNFQPVQTVPQRVEIKKSVDKVNIPDRENKKPDPNVDRGPGVFVEENNFDSAEEVECLDGAVVRSSSPDACDKNGGRK